jgi:hypothetical protein
MRIPGYFATLFFTGVLAMNVTDFAASVPAHQGSGGGCQGRPTVLVHQPQQIDRRYPCGDHPFRVPARDADSQRS